MIRKAILICIGLCLLAACGDDEPKSVPESTYSVTGGIWDDVHWEYVVVETPNGPLECVFAQADPRNGGPSCNWEEYNKAK